MAVTIVSSPASPTPVYNEQFLSATSTQTAQPNFTYTIIVTDVITSTVIATDYVKADINGKLLYDIGTYAEKYVQNYIPVNLYGWKKCANATRKIRFNIGETYGATPTYYAGANTDYIVSNAGLDKIYMAPYSPNYICYDTTIPNLVFGTTLPNKTYVDRSLYLYVLCQANVGEFTTLEVATFDSAGTQLGAYQIDRPDSGTGLYSDNYQCIGVGYKDLLGITAPFVIVNAGTYPIITSSVASYKLWATDGSNTTLLQTITVDCNPRFEVYTLHYLNSKGGYESINCSLAHTLSSTKLVSTFKKSMWTFPSGIPTLDPALLGEKVQGVTIQDNLILNTDWLTDAEFAIHKDLFTSTDVRLDLGSSTTYKGVKVTDTGYTTFNTERLRQLQINLSYTHQNNRQRG